MGAAGTNGRGAEDAAAARGRLRTADATRSLQTVPRHFPKTEMRPMDRIGTSASRSKRSAPWRPSGPGRVPVFNDNYSSPGKIIVGVHTWHSLVEPVHCSVKFIRWLRSCFVSGLLWTPSCAARRVFEETGESHASRERRRSAERSERTDSFPGDTPNLLPGDFGAARQRRSSSAERVPHSH